MPRKAINPKLQPLWETEARTGPGLDARGHLLEAAATAFMVGGYSSTTLEDVAAQTGMTKGQIYHYYRSKVDLYFDVVVGAYFMLNERIRPIAEAADPDAEARLRRVAFEHSLVMMATFPFQKVALEATQFQFQSGSSDRQHRAMERMFQFRNDYERLIGSIVAEGARSGVFEVTSISLATKAALGALNWITVWYDPRRSPNEAHKKALAELLSAFVVGGMKKPALDLSPLFEATRSVSLSLAALRPT